MRLISWTLRSGSEHVDYFIDGFDHRIACAAIVSAIDQDIFSVVVLIIM
jgi:hypothetical protein